MAAHETHDESIVVATLNLLDDLRFWDERRTLIVDGFARVSPDLIALQEISLEEGNAAWLAEELGGYTVHVSPQGPDAHSDSLAILSRLPVEEHRILELEEQDRSAHSVTVRHGGAPLVFANTHLYWHPISESVRVAQAQRVLAWLPPGTPAVLCGDLNTFPRSETVAFLKSHLHSAYAAAHGVEPAYTYPTLLKRGPGMRHSARDVVLRANGLLRTRRNVKHGGTVDYIFVTPDLQVEECELVFETPAPHDERLYASDHVGLWARLRPAGVPTSAEGGAARAEGAPILAEGGAARESVWDYPRPPRVETTSRRVRVVFEGVTIADTRNAKRVLETSHPPAYYIPPQDCLTAHLQPNPRQTVCEFKGVAHYYDVVVGARRAAAAAWYYPRPVSGYGSLQDHVAFYPGRIDACYVDDELVEAQPGDFYGGWITKDVVGPFKGGPGTRGW